MSEVIENEESVSSLTKINIAEQIEVSKYLNINSIICNASFILYVLFCCSIILVILI